MRYAHPFIPDESSGSLPKRSGQKRKWKVAKAIANAIFNLDVFGTFSVNFGKVPF